MVHLKIKNMRFELEIGWLMIEKLSIVVAFIFLIIFIVFQNNSIQNTSIKYENKMIPKVFNGYKILHISDLHNKSFGKNQKILLEKIEAESPDIIVITGDLIDRRKYDLKPAEILVESAIKIAPVYYVSGNHEAWSGKYKSIKEMLTRLGVDVLDNRKIDISINNEKITLLGVSDPNFLTSTYFDDTNILNMEENLDDLSNTSNFQILLSHRPELFKLYNEKNIDLIFSGHAHGGQFRLPFIGGVIAPNQGFFPKYTSGVYKMNQSTLIVSRGLGNSIIPIRLFNRPELVVVTLFKN